MRDINDAKTDESVEAGLSRRTLVRAAGHSLWAVPAITLATAAPAMAVSGTWSYLSGGPRNSSGNQNSPSTVPITINRSTGSSAVQITVTPNKGNSTVSANPSSFDPNHGLNYSFIISDSDSKTKSYTIVVTDGISPAPPITTPSF